MSLASGAAREGATAGVTLLVLGNPLLGDDGLGERLLALLHAHWRVPPELEVVLGGNAALDLLPVVEDAARLLVIDAIDAGRVPGDLVVLEGEQIPRALGRALSAHQVGIAQILALASVRGRLPERVAALGLQPGRLREGIGLSAEVEAALPELLEALVGRLAAWGIHLRPQPLRSAAAAAAGYPVRSDAFR